MKRHDLFPQELGKLQRLRQQYPHRPYSELLDALLLARIIVPEATVSEWETVASYILEISEPRDSSAC